MGNATCALDGCEKPVAARGWCGMHYMRIKRRGEPGPPEISLIPMGTHAHDRLRIVGWNVTPAGCWEWRGSRYQTGYGALTVAARKMGYAHRVAWEAANGPIPDGMFVCHRCDNPPCVNPAHLFLGAPADNVRDMRQKGRHAYGETNGHARLTDAQVAEIRSLRSVGTPAKEVAERYGVTRGYVYGLTSASRPMRAT